MANYAFGNDLDGFYPTITRESYLRQQAKSTSPVGWKPDHYASAGHGSGDFNHIPRGLSASALRVST